MKLNPIQKHMLGTYGSLRVGLAVIGGAFPWLLWVLGWLWFGVPFQPSMSDYYFAESSGKGLIRQALEQVDFLGIKQLLGFLSQFDASTPMRSWFVGFLFALGVLMILYRGFSRRENWLLNAAGSFALGVALFPTGCRDCFPFSLHGVCAVAAFLCIALVAEFCAKQTLTVPFQTPGREEHYERLYKWTGRLMLAFPVLAVAVNYLVWSFAGGSGLWDAHVVFFLEAFGLGCFAIYWWVKSRELEENRAEQLAAEGKLMPFAPAPGPTRAPAPAAEAVPELTPASVRVAPAAARPYAQRLRNALEPPPLTVAM